MTLEEIQASLDEQIERHRILKLIVEALEALRADDPEGVEWVIEKLTE